HNLSSDGTGNLTAAGDLPNTNPLLDTLRNNGGPTPTMQLLTFSPAIDAGVAIAGGTTDQRGVAGSEGLAPDIGAFETIGARVLSIAYEYETRQAVTFTFAGDARG